MVQSVLEQEAEAEAEARSLPRTRLFLSATIRFDTVSAPIQLRDLSASGARIEGKILPPVGTSAQISRGALAAGGSIIWRDPNGCGIRFDRPLMLELWMPTRAQDQQAVDAIVDAARSGTAGAGALRAVRPSSQTFRDVLPQRLAEELAYVMRLLEALGDDLCAEPLLVMRHAEKLQNLDISSQILGHVATLLVAEQPEQAIKSIGMTSLRKRLQRVAL